MRRCWPLTKPARLLARYWAASATSATVPMRLIGRMDWMSCATSSGTPPVKTPAPSVAVGRIELTVTPRTDLLGQHFYEELPGDLAGAVGPHPGLREGGAARTDVDDASVV